jgi:putative Mg2+ transporter-C (MgtC) family protein
MIETLETLLQVILAAVLGGLLGFEREFGKKEAGLRTYMLVCVGSCLFTLLAFSGPEISESYIVSPDPLRVIQAVAIGIGFIGSGVIIFRRDHVEGLTTAAGLWVVAAIGVAVGLKLYLLASFATFLSVLILGGLLLIEKRLLNK